MDKKFLIKCVARTYMISLKSLLENKNKLMKEFNLTSEQIDNMPYWQYEEAINLLKYKIATK